MLFHDPIFLFAFLPVVIASYLLLWKCFKQKISVIGLGVASLIFYAWWDPRYLSLILVSIIFNFYCGRYLQIRSLSNSKKRAVLILGIVFNLIPLFVFKYLNFVVDSINFLVPYLLRNHSLELPLGISFFSFLQIAYLIDSMRGEVKKSNFSSYLLFVTFFPHLIAGPLIHHSEMIPQFLRKPKSFWNNFAIGQTIFLAGLFKKLVLAPQMALWSDSVFDSAAVGIAPTLIEGWVGALCFSLEIYFDFSGYSDMAIGLSRIFGICMPVNFSSPYKAANIIEFWRRWHMTLSRFFRDYLYIPLGGSRVGPFRESLNLLLVMLVAGLWHGADWKFVLWGGLHGLLLLICHGWVSFRRTFFNGASFIPAWLSVLLTFLVVVLTWVPFRSNSIATATLIFCGMFGLNGLVLPIHYQSFLGNSLGAWVDFGVMSSYAGGFQVLLISLYIVFIWLLPNTQQIMRYFNPALIILGQDYRAASLPRYIAWYPTVLTGVLAGAIAVYLSLLVIQGKSGEFIYFRF